MILSLLFAAQIAVSSPGTTPQSQPWVDADAQQTVVVWVESSQIRFSRIRFDGTRLDDGKVIGTRGTSPRIATNGANHLVVWMDQSDVFGRFLALDGTTIGDVFSITDTADVDTANVIAVGSAYVVAWSGPHANIATVDVHQRIDRLDVLPHDVPIVGDISVAPDGENVLLAYNTQDQIATFPITTTISTILVSLSDATGATPIVIASRTTAVGSAGLIFVRTPRLAPHGDGFLLGWTQDNGPGRGSFAFIAQLDGNGKEVGDPIMAGSSFGSSDYPAATAIPVDDRVITVDYPTLVEGTLDFHCGCVTKTVLANAMTSVAPSFSNMSAATLPGGGIVVAYEYGTREEGEPLTNARPRVFVQFLDVPVPPPPVPSRHRPSRP